MITEGLVNAGTNSIVKLGGITVGFFVLLGVVIYMLDSFMGGTTTVHAEIQSTVRAIEMRQIEFIDAADEERKLNNYFQRQICLNTSRTDLQRTGCNPKPSIISL